MCRVRSTSSKLLNYLFGALRRGTCNFCDEYVKYDIEIYTSEGEKFLIALFPMQCFFRVLRGKSEIGRSILSTVPQERSSDYVCGAYSIFKHACVRKLYGNIVWEEPITRVALCSY